MWLKTRRVIPIVRLLNTVSLETSQDTPGMSHWLLRNLVRANTVEKVIASFFALSDSDIKLLDLLIVQLKTPS